MSTPQMQTKILTGERLKRYAERRLFGSNVTSDTVHRIELFNGVLPSHLEEILGKMSKGAKGFVKVDQANPREPLYFMDGTLYIPQYSGFGRAMRYQRLLETYKEAVESCADGCGSGRKLEILVHELKGVPRKTDQSYSNSAYDFVTGLFIPSFMYDTFRVFEDEDVKDITTIIFGPIEIVAKSAKVIAKGNSEYLDAQIVEVDGQKVLNIGYVFADQAGMILEKMLREYHSIAKKHAFGNNTPLNLNIYMFGRVGGLVDDIDRHHLVYPVGVIDEVDLREGRPFVYPMHNVLASPNEKGLVFNVSTVVDETFEQLRSAKNQGCICVEMETRESVEAINQARRRYHGLLDISFGFVGYVSDNPLKGDLLDKELDSQKGEKEALDVILKAITQQKRYQISRIKDQD